ncbi:MAG: hypothetical protein L3J11_00700 [Draconibacterium sp.]|nr:hypothetical protein [Draconibacterium sp.]
MSTQHYPNGDVGAIEANDTICKENNCSPRNVYKFHLETMRERLDKIKSGAEFIY